MHPRTLSSGTALKKKKPLGASLGAQWLRLHTPNAGGWGLIPGWGTRSHIPQPGVHMLQLEIPRAALKTEGPKCHNQDLIQPDK